jgi:hypothetical protein
MGANWESFPMERIKKDLFEVIVNLGVGVIEFCDDEFFGGRTEENIRRAYAIAEYIGELRARYGRKIRFRLFTRPDFVYTADDHDGNESIRYLLVKFKEIGLTRIYIGIESGSSSQLARYNRGLTKEMIKGALSTLEEVGIKYDGGYILFDKSLSLGEMLESIEFYESTHLIESNQWIWRPLVASVGSAIGRELGASPDRGVNWDSMEVGYAFDDAIIQKMHELIDMKSSETRELFYALKIISKEDYDYEDRGSAHYAAHELVKQNGLAYVRFLKKMADLILGADPAPILDDGGTESGRGGGAPALAGIADELASGAMEKYGNNNGHSFAYYARGIRLLVEELDGEVARLADQCKGYCDGAVFSREDSQVLLEKLRNSSLGAAHMSEWGI